MKSFRGKSRYHKEPPFCDLDEITGNRPSVNRYWGRSISVPFAEPSFYALGWINFLCHASMRRSGRRPSTSPAARTTHERRVLRAASASPASAHEACCRRCKGQEAAARAAASASGKGLLEMLVDDLRHLEHRHLRLAEDRPQLLVGIDHALVDGDLQDGRHIHKHHW